MKNKKHTKSESGNSIINRRIEYFTKKKQALLKMKKAERRGELATVDDAIARLKRWNIELEVKKMKETQGAGQRMAKACEKTVKACQEMSEAFAKMNDRRNDRGVNPVVYK